MLYYYTTENIFLYGKAPSDYELLYSFEHSYFGKLGYYAQPVYYTYYKEGNKIYNTNADIFTIVNDKLIMDGGGGTWTKFTPGAGY